MRNVTLVSILALLMGVTVGCDNTPAATDAGAGDAGGGGGDAGVRTDAGPIDDGNDSFAEAEELLTTGASMGAIENADDRDYYSFTASAGDWVGLFISANSEDDPDRIDTVITLYDSTMTQIAENDDAVPRINVDSEIVIQIPADGTYYVEVQEFSTWMDETPQFGADFTYELSYVTAFNEELFTFPTENGTTETPLNFLAGTSIDSGYLCGELDAADDEDVYSFTVAAGRESTEFTVMPRGTDGYGSTSLPLRVWVTNAAGDTVIANLGPSTFETADLDAEFSPQLPPGDYQLHVLGASSTGANDFYVIKFYRGGGNDPEADDTANNMPATAQALDVMTDTDDATIRRGFIVVDLEVGDTDHFSFSTLATEQVNVFCASASSGSGVDALQLRLLNPRSTPDAYAAIATETETATEGAFIEDQTVPDADLYVVELTRGGTQLQAGGADITGNYVRCGVRLAPPSTTP